MLMSILILINKLRDEPEARNQRPESTKMKITINYTADALDPNNTAEDAEQSLRNYIAELTAEIQKEFPGADIEHAEIDDTYQFRVSDDPDGSIADEVQSISERVYETGNFWA